MVLFQNNKLLDVKVRVKKRTSATLKQKGVMNKNIVIKLDDYKHNQEVDNSDIKKEK